MAVNIGPRIGIEGEAQFRREMQQIIAQAKALKTEYKAVSSELDKNGSAQKKAAEQSRILTAQIGVQKEKIASLSGMVAKSSQKYGENDAKTLKWKASLNTARAELSEMQKALRAVPTRIEQVGASFSACGEKITAAAQKVGSVAGSLTTRLTLPLAAAGTAAAKFAMDFEKSMAKVGTIAQGVDLGTVGDEILALSDTTGVAASDLAESVYQAISAGQESADAVRFVSDTVRLAKGGFADTGAALDVLTTALNAYGAAAGSAEHVSDILITTQNLGKVTVAQLAEELGGIIPTAAAYGISLENLGSAYVVLTKQGINAATATTNLNGMISEMSKVGSKSAKILQEETGKSFLALIGEGRTLSDVVMILKTRAERTGTTINSFFGNIRAGRAALALTNDNGAEFARTMDAMRTSAGAAGAAFEKMASTDAYKTQIALNRLKNAGITAGQSLLKILVPTVEKVGALIEKAATRFDAMSDAEKEATIKLLLFAAAAPPVIKAISGIVGVGGKIISTFGTMFSAIGGSLSTMLPIAGAVAAVLGGIIYMATREQDATQKALDDAKKLRAEADDLASSVKEEREARESTAADMETQAKMADDLIARLRTLNAQSKLTKEEQTELHITAEKLNAIYPDLALSVDAYTGHLTKNSAAILDNAEAIKNQAMAAAKKEALEAAVKNQVALGMETDQVREKLEKARAAAEAAKGSAEGMTDLSLVGAKYAEVQELTEGLSALEEQLAASNAEVASASAAWDTYTDATSTAASATVGAGEAAAGASDALSALEEAYTNAYLSAWAAAEQQVGAFDLIEQKSNVTLESMRAGLQSQVSAFSSYAANLTQLSELAATGTVPNLQRVLEYITSLGIDGAGYLSALVEAAEAENGSLEAILADFGAAQEAKGTFAEAMAEFSTTTADAMTDTGAAITEGAELAGDSAEAAGKKLMSDMAAGIRIGKKQVLAEARAAASAAVNAFAGLPQAAAGGARGGGGQTVIKLNGRELNRGTRDIRVGGRIMQ